MPKHHSFMRVQPYCFLEVELTATLYTNNPSQPKYKILNVGNVSFEAHG